VGSFPLNTKERAVANWVYLNRKAAGAGTETLTQALGLYLPLVVSDRVEAVLAIDYSKVTLLRHELDGLVDTIGQLASVSLERENFREHTVELQVLQVGFEPKLTCFDFRDALASIPLPYFS
jgi:two-component system sensor histidine kinase KdpD